jgi:hypothetical protein
MSKNGQRWAISLVQKALDVSWDVWEQRNDIKHNTLHPREFGFTPFGVLNDIACWVDVVGSTWLG